MPVAPPPPAPSGWQDQTTQMPTYQPPAGPPTVPQGPPTAPPGPPGPPTAPPAAPPGYGAPPAAGGWGTGQLTGPGQFGGQAGTPYGAPAGSPAAPPAAEKKSKAPLLIGLAVLALLVVGGIVAAVLVLSGGDSDLDLAIDTCEIQADGTMNATGAVINDGGDEATVTVEVVFSDSATQDEISSQRARVTSAGGSSGRWSATGNAGDSVQRVTCEATLIP